MFYLITKNSNYFHLFIKYVINNLPDTQTVDKIKITKIAKNFILMCFFKLFWKLVEFGLRTVEL